jgi:hypothetical protein
MLINSQMEAFLMPITSKLKLKTLQLQNKLLQCGTKYSYEVLERTGLCVWPATWVCLAEIQRVKLLESGSRHLVSLVLGLITLSPICSSFLMVSGKKLLALLSACIFGKASFRPYSAILLEVFQFSVLCICFHANDD